MKNGIFEMMVARGMPVLWLSLLAGLYAKPLGEVTHVNAGLNANMQKSNAMIDNRLLSANTQFGFTLFAKLAHQDKGKNIFVSPSSVAFALAMIYNGTSGETQQAMAKSLELQGMRLPEVNQANAALKAALENPDPRVRLSIANSLWARKGVKFKPEFIKRNKDFYQAEVADLDFAAPEAPATINRWVSRKTNSKITQIVDRIDPHSILVLINAIHFKGHWALEFDKSKTREGVFTLLNGAKKKHPMMWQSGRYPYYRGNQFQAISLPYGEGRISMFIFLPDNNSLLEKFLANLNAANWQNWMSQFRVMPGDITLPRFKLEYEVVLNSALKALGMEIAFDPQRADFREMYSGASGVNVYLGEVKHKTFVEVNEEGTEAAAVTSGQMLATSYTPPFSMVVDRPFFCAIRDNQTGMILFMGTIVAPM